MKRISFTNGIAAMFTIASRVRPHSYLGCFAGAWSRGSFDARAEQTDESVSHITVN